MEDYRIEPASGDASFRRYFRVFPATGESLIVMDAPPDKEDCRPFVDVSARLETAGVHVPHIHAQDLKQGFLLLEDLGDRLYLGALTPQTADALYGEAIAALVRIQRGRSAGLPRYDKDLLLREMALFPEWLLGVHLGLSLSPAERDLLDQAFALLVDNALEQPQVLVHRDYHSRNLLVCGRHGPGVIDFQDAVLGPLSYDLVSLLRDCYIRWPRERVMDWVERYASQARRAGVLEAEAVGHLPTWFDRMGIQRHLKAAGIFARLMHRDGKPGYLGDIPRTLEYIIEVAGDDPQLSGLAELIARRVLPGVRAA
jgi:aminoglycoside/choline kinase family phosphotransferase